MEADMANPLPWKRYQCISFSLVSVRVHVIAVCACELHRCAWDTNEQAWHRWIVLYFWPGNVVIHLKHFCLENKI